MSSDSGGFEARPERMLVIGDDLESTTRFLEQTVRELAAIACDPRAFGRLGMVVGQMVLEQVSPQFATTFAQLHGLANRSTEDVRSSARAYAEADERHGTAHRDAVSPMAGMNHLPWTGTVS